MTKTSRSPGPGTSPLVDQLQRQIAELERRHAISPDEQCSLTPAEMSRAAIACGSGPRCPGEPAGCGPAASKETAVERLRADFSPRAVVERLLGFVRFFDRRVAETLAVDWQLPSEELDHAVAAGFARHSPELADEVRRVIAGNFSYSHA